MGDRTRDMSRLLLAVALLAAAAHGYQNGNGSSLQRCSGPGTALTGFTRNGQCVDQNDDAGSHHICIDMSSATGGNFCTITGQPNWCSSSMQCDGGPGQCKIKNWCVCQWAFASYIERAGGCDKIQQIDLVRPTWWRSRRTSSRPRPTPE